MKQEDLEYKLDVLAKTLQTEVYNLLREDKNPGDKECSEADGIVKALKYINSEFGKNYETDLGNILSHYETPLQSRPRKI